MPIFDVVVVGGGPSGEEASGRLADHGLSVALLEDRLVGRECVDWVCMPSKALLRPYEALAEAGRDEIIGAPDDSALIPWVESHGITLVRGHGRIVDERRVMVGDEELEARQAVILSVDSQPLVPAIEGLGDLEPGRVWTNREATTTREILRSLVVGGGPEGVELAQAFQTLGSQVTLIEALHRVLPHAEEFASDQVTAALQEHGVEVLAGHSVVNFSQQRGRVALKTSAGSTAAGDVVLIAVGRRQTSEDLGIETVGLERGALVAVDEHMRAPTAPWLYAVGDINGRALLTHMGRYAAGGRPHPRSGARDRPWRRRNTGAARDLHRSPGRERGPHLRDRHPRGGRVRHLRHGHLRHHAAQRRRLLLRPERAGHRPLHRRPRAAGPVGCTITGSEVVDFLHPATIAVVAKVPLERLRHAVPPFPTRSELWLSLLEQAGV